jgi:elongation factor 1-gamma
MRRDTELCGASLTESAQVNTWIDFCSQELEIPMTVWLYPVLGYMPYYAASTSSSKADISRALTTLNTHLVDKTYLVGNHVTLADITVMSALVYLFKFLADEAYRAPFAHVNRWFDTLCHQPQVEAVIGRVILCTKELTAAGQAPIPFTHGAPTSTTSAAAAAAPAASATKEEKKEKGKKDKGAAADKSSKPKEEKKPKEKKEKPAAEPKKPEPKSVEPEDDFEEKPVKKEDHPFKILDRESPSSFVMDTWKKTYSNCTSYEEAMKEFWETFDASGWSLWRGDYNYNSENSVLFMTSNLIGGFIQRTEEIRKWLFGTMTIRGEAKANGMKITAYYLIRGQSIQPLIDCNTDAECYTWTKMVTPPTDQDKALLFEYWTSETSLENEPLLDSRCYK